VAFKFIIGEIEGKSVTSVSELCEFLIPTKTAFSSVYKSLYAEALTISASGPTAVCEASFCSNDTNQSRKPPIDESDSRGDLMIMALIHM